jgi:hypothetical protein
MSVLVWEGEHFALALVQASQAFRFLISWGAICELIEFVDEGAGKFTVDQSANGVGEESGSHMRRNWVSHKTVGAGIQLCAEARS